ncbi:MAG TPA: hypothetical protein VGG49_07585 [Steroidobacteraceae bacterium]|jgi:tetratricopeptide (TPR) repeat protein
MRLLRAAVVFSLVSAGVAQAAATDTDWRDVESRIQYAWYTEDARDLAVIADQVTDLPPALPLRSYYLALIELHEAQLALRRASASASAAAGATAPAAGTTALATVGQAAAACISSADEALAARPTDAEVLALQSECMDLRSRTRSLDVPFAQTRSTAQMQRALHLAPTNPRVQLLAAQLAYAEAKSTQQRAQLLATFQGAVDAFELERQGLERVPAWGGAEAWQGLAQIYLERGDAIAARSALEHALLLMPDYASAHRLLNHIVRG